MSASTLLSRHALPAATLRTGFVSGRRGLAAVTNRAYSSGRSTECLYIRRLPARALLPQAQVNFSRNFSIQSRRQGAGLSGKSQSESYEAVVVGAGPAGVTCVGNLLERGVQPILWVDESFNGGRVNARYREVPSNTRVALFVDFATAVEPFKKIAGDAEGGPKAMQTLRSLEQGKGCELGLAADMIVMLTEGLKRTPGILAKQGRVAGAILDESSGKWTVKVDEASTSSAVEAQRLVLCTGSSPTSPPLPMPTPQKVRYLDLDAAISPSHLAEVLGSRGPTTVGVIGASHSAILVLRNLYNLASSTNPDLKIKWFTRHALRYAEHKDGWILRDNTGLKGEVAVWAKENLEPTPFKSSDVRNYIEPINYSAGAEPQVFAEHLSGVDFVVQAIGFTRDPTPTLTTGEGKSIKAYYDHIKGSFDYVREVQGGAIGELAPVPGLFGAGIAYPERVTDPAGNVEYAVGFFKFMKFVKRVVKGWN